MTETLAGSARGEPLQLHSPQLFLHEKFRSVNGAKESVRTSPGLLRVSPLHELSVPFCSFLTCFCNPVPNLSKDYVRRVRITVSAVLHSTLCLLFSPVQNSAQPLPAEICPSYFLKISPSRATNTLAQRKLRSAYSPQNTMLVMRVRFTSPFFSVGHSSSAWRPSPAAHTVIRSSRPVSHRQRCKKERGKHAVVLTLPVGRRT